MNLEQGTPINDFRSKKNLKSKIVNPYSIFNTVYKKFVQKKVLEDDSILNLPSSRLAC